MRTSTIVWVVAIVIIVFGGGYWFVKDYNPNTLAGVIDGDTPRPATDDVGINGSPNQGDLGASSTGVQQPGADGAEGTVIGGNVALGLNRSETLGAYLIGYNGMTLYTFSKDKIGTSTCYGKCAENWPPYTVGPEDNVHNVKLGVHGEKTDSITRAGGKIQVTYGGMPLYFYAGDSASGDTNGEKLNNLWFVAKP